MESERESGVKVSDFLILSCGVLLNALAQLGLKAATRVSWAGFAPTSAVAR